MNLIYYDLYQATRLEKFVTGKLLTDSYIEYICHCILARIVVY